MNRFIFLLLFSLISFKATAQADSLSVDNDNAEIVQKKFDEDRLDSYRTDEEFNYNEEKTKEEPTLIGRIFNWLGRQILRFLEWLVGVESAEGVFGAILSSIPYILAGIVVILLLKFFLKVNLDSFVIKASNKAFVSVTEEEELIKNKDLSKLIQKAIAQKNYRLAVRYYYLDTLGKLEKNELIKWEQQKTNEDYLKEITLDNIKTAFKKLTRLYDFVWYGSFEINEMEFASVSSDFERTGKLISKR